MDYKNYPLPFCNSIQESNNSVFDSRSCTHVLKQVKVMQVINKPNTFVASKNSIPKVLGWSIFAREKKERKHQELCVQEMRNNESWVCIYSV